MVSYHGYIQKLTGTEFVLQAMKLLENENIKLNIIGGGELYADMKKLAFEELNLKNVEFFPPMKPQQLIPKVCEAHVVLGLFGEGKKGHRVIAIKIFEGMSLHLSVVTADSQATAEHFKHKQHIYYVPPANSQAIADALLELKNDRKLCQSIADNALKQVEANFTPQVLGSKLLPELEKLL